MHRAIIGHQNGLT